MPTIQVSGNNTMAHSHDRTLLASLAFGDKDKQDRRHDLACQYLAQPEIAAKFIPVIWPNLNTSDLEEDWEFCLW